MFGAAVPPVRRLRPGSVLEIYTEDCFGGWVRLQPPLQERVRLYEIDRGAGTVTYHATRSNTAIALPLDPMHGTVGVAPGEFGARHLDPPRFLNRHGNGAHGAGAHRRQLVVLRDRSPRDAAAA